MVPDIKFIKSYEHQVRGDFREPIEIAANYRGFLRSFSDCRRTCRQKETLGEIVKQIIRNLAARFLIDSLLRESRLPCAATVQRE